MNISRIQNIRFFNFLNQTNQKQDYTSNFGLRMADPLNADTVSFTATPKFNNKKLGVSLDTAKKIHEKVEPYQKDIMSLIKELFDDLVANEYHPDYPIYAIKNRVKSALSIKEKSASRQWNNTEERVLFLI